MEQSILQLEKQIEEQIIVVNEALQEAKCRQNREYQDKYSFERTGLLYGYQKIATAYKKQKNLSKALEILYFLKEDFEELYPESSYNPFDSILYDNYKVKEFFKRGEGVAPVHKAELIKKISYYHSLNSEYLAMINIHHEELKNVFSMKYKSGCYSHTQPLYVSILATHLAKVCKSKHWLKNNKFYELGRVANLVSIAAEGCLAFPNYAKQIIDSTDTSYVRTYYFENLADFNTLDKNNQNEDISLEEQRAQTQREDSIVDQDFKESRRQKKKTKAEPIFKNFLSFLKAELLEEIDKSLMKIDKRKKN